MAPEPLGVVGAGWVGLVTAASFAELGHDVVVRDVVPRARRRPRGRATSPSTSRGSPRPVARNRDRLRFTLDLDELLGSVTAAFVCVGTPSTYSGDADLSAVWQVVDELPEPGEPLLLVMKSTVPVGTGERVRARLDARGLAHVGYVSNPEFLAEGTALANFMEPDRVVVGGFAQADADRVAALYEPLDAPIVRTDIASAEMIKLASNAALMTRISFINEIANVCELVGADVDGGRARRRPRPAPRPALPARRHRLRRLVLPEGRLGAQAARRELGLPLPASHRRDRGQRAPEAARRRRSSRTTSGRCAEKTVALLGLAFKPHTNDMREAPSLVLAPRLLAEGAEVRAWDPVALDEARRLLGGVELLRDRARGRARTPTRP